MSKVKMLLDVVSEVKNEAPQDVPNWNSKFAEAKINLQRQIAKGRLLPKGVEDHPLEHFAFNYSVQRDVRAGHVMNIMKKFDPRVCCPVSAVKRSDAERKKDSLKDNFPDCFIIRENVNLNDY